MSDDIIEFLTGLNKSYPIIFNNGYLLQHKNKSITSGKFIKTFGDWNLYTLNELTLSVNNGELYVTHDNISHLLIEKKYSI